MKNVLGINEFFLNSAYNYTVESESVCNLYRIQRDDFLKIFEKKSFLRTKVYKII